ncbi:MAG TPA: citrate synthase, partial [Nitrospiraceae bacterium]|nr:citrate synthase [Nitrospiraceae bacterium]
ELNASTFAARVTASTLADLYGAVTAAIATLKGPLHGGANEAVAEMFQAIQDPGKAQGWVHSKLTGKERVMGFGHRVLKHEDPRSAIIKRRAKALSQHADEMRWYEIAEIIEQTMKEEKGLLPNLDFYTAVVYLLIGIPKEAFTPIFVASRMSGWCAHIIEQQDNNRLIRPRAFYIGPPSREFLFIGDR